MARTNGLGWLRSPKDGRDFKFLMRHAAKQIDQIAPPAPRQRAYQLGPLLNQGPTPMCVGYSTKGHLLGAPMMSKADAKPTAADIYRGAQQNDEWPGENYEGSSVRGSVKYLMKIGIISGYTWAQNVDEATTWMNGGYGTVVVGTNWYAAMDDVDRNGFIKMPSVLATPIGGHAYRIIWFDKKKGGYLVRNSWGDQWGMPKTGGTLTGTAYLTRDAFERLLNEDGEIAGPTQIKVAATSI